MNILMNNPMTGDNIMASIAVLLLALIIVRIEFASALLYRLLANTAVNLYSFALKLLGMLYFTTADRKSVV